MKIFQSLASSRLEEIAVVSNKLLQLEAAFLIKNSQLGPAIIGIRWSKAGMENFPRPDGSEAAQSAEAASDSNEEFLSMCGMELGLGSGRLYIPKPPSGGGDGLREEFRFFEFMGRMIDGFRGRLFLDCRGFDLRRLKWLATTTRFIFSGRLAGKAEVLEIACRRALDRHGRADRNFEIFTDPGQYRRASASPGRGKDILIPPVVLSILDYSLLECSELHELHTRSCFQDWLSEHLAFLFGECFRTGGSFSDCLKRFGAEYLAAKGIDSKSA